MSDRIRIKLSAPGGLGLREAWRLYLAALRLRRMVRQHGYEKTVTLLEQAAARPGSNVTVRRSQ